MLGSAVMSFIIGAELSYSRPFLTPVRLFDRLYGAVAAPIFQRVIESYYFGSPRTIPEPRLRLALDHMVVSVTGTGRAWVDEILARTGGQPAGR